MRKYYVLGTCVAVATLFLVSCGSTNSGTAPVPPVSAPVLPTSGNFSTTVSVTPAASAGATQIVVPLPPAGQYGGQLTLPVTNVPPALQLRMTYSNTVPAGLTAFSELRGKQPAGARTPLEVLSRNVVYACLASNQLVQLSQPPRYSYILPIQFNAPGAAYYGALYQNGAWVGDYAGPADVAPSSSGLTVSMTGRFGFSIAANGSVCAALYARQTDAPSPTPPTSGVLNLNSTTLTFKTNAPQTISATESGYSGLFSATSAKPAVATAVVGLNGQIIVTPLAIGTTTITITAGTQTATVTVVVMALTPAPVGSPSPAPTTTPSPAPAPSPSPTAFGTPTPSASAGETFTGSSTTANAWQFGGDACLTAGNAATPLTSVRACSNASLDSPGAGTLQLTSNALSRTGFVISNTAILTGGRSGLNVGFDYFAYNGTSPGADGISVFLLDANQPQPTAVGAAGSGLGYALGDGTPGVRNAYLGVGLDSYGNFSVGGATRGPTGNTPQRVPETVAVRGAESTNYHYIGGYTSSPNVPASLPFPLDAPGLNRPPVALHVLVTINSLQNTVTVAINGTVYVNALSLAGGGQPMIPSRVFIGFAGSTGGFTDIHQVRNVLISAF